MMNGSGYGKNDKEGDREWDREDLHLPGKVRAEQSRLCSLCGSTALMTETVIHQGDLQAGLEGTVELKGSLISRKPMGKSLQADLSS